MEAQGRPRPAYAVGERLDNNASGGDNVGGMSIIPAITLERLLGSRLSTT